MSGACVGIQHLGLYDNTFSFIYHDIQNELNLKICISLCRKLQKQHKQLATWIVDEEGTVSELEIQEVKAEVEEVITTYVILIIYIYIQF